MGHDTDEDELHINESARLATRTVEAMAGLWAVEEAVRGQSPQARANDVGDNGVTYV